MMMNGPKESTANVAMLEPENNGNSPVKPFVIDLWVNTLDYIAKHYRLKPSIEIAKRKLVELSSVDSIESIQILAKAMGLGIRQAHGFDIELNSWQLPVVVQLRTGQPVVLHTISSDNMVELWSAEGGNRDIVLPLDTFLAHVDRVYFLQPVKKVQDARVDDYIKPYEENWLRKLAFQDIGSYGHVLLASVLTNILGMAGILFSMQVYDRVVPSQSMTTLFVLFSGVVLAIVFDFFLRQTRTGIIDLLGKRTDLQMSDLVFGHALRVKNTARPTSTGSYIAQLRDIDQVREMLTSTTVAAVADLPFFFLFLFVFWWLAGPLVFIPLCALIAMILPGLFLQKKLRAMANEAMREASLRNAVLVETVQGIEDIKSLQAESRFQNQWNQLNLVTGEAQIKMRALTNGLNAWTQKIQAIVYAVIILVGAPMVIAGDITTGVLIGASILGSRMLAPMGQVSQILGRLQHAKIAKAGLDKLMQMPVDHPDDETRIHCPKVSGNYHLKDAVFRYGDQTTPPCLFIKEMSICEGDRIAALGRNGAGKSTLLLALSGMLEASDGLVQVENLSMGHIDPADIRRDVGLLTQNSRLFFGTVRENLIMGAPQASDDDIQRALAVVGADSFVKKLPKGLEYTVQEGGRGLSGGQKQSILLARLLIRNPSVILLDEPTAAMDEATERHFVREFAKWSIGKTVVISTHRMRVLELVNRILVFENGTIGLDDTKERALLTLKGVSPVDPSKPTLKNFERA